MLPSSPHLCFINVLILDLYVLCNVSYELESRHADPTIKGPLCLERR